MTECSRLLLQRMTCCCPISVELNWHHNNRSTWSCAAKPKQRSALRSWKEFPGSDKLPFLFQINCDFPSWKGKIMDYLNFPEKPNFSKLLVYIKFMMSFLSIFRKNFPEYLSEYFLLQFPVYPIKTGCKKRFEWCSFLIFRGTPGIWLSIFHWQIKFSFNRLFTTFLLPISLQPKFLPFYCFYWSR